MDPETEKHVHESPLSMTGVLVVLAVLSALGGFIPVVHYLEPHAAAAEGATRHCTSRAHPDRPSRWVRLRRPGAGAWFFFGGNAAAPAAGAPRLAGVHRGLANKYYVDELYEAGSAGHWSGSRSASSCNSATAR